MMKKIVSVLLTAAIIAGTLCVFSFADCNYKPYDNSEYYSIGDYDIHYRIFPAENETKGRILLIHGFACSTYAWRNMASAFCAKGYECVAVDLPNFGYSTRETKDTEVIAREDIIISLMKSIAPTDEWIIAGHSMGGGVAVNIAESVPIKALMLYCPCPQNEFPQWAKGICTSSVMEWAMNEFFEHGTKIKPLVKLVIYAATNDWNFADNYDISGVTNPVQYDGFGAGMCEMMYNVKPTDLEAVNKITCPVLLCQADKDIILSSSQKEQMNSAFPDAVTYTVEGGGHQCIENRAQELCNVSIDFLDNCKQQ